MMFAVNRGCLFNEKIVFKEYIMAGKIKTVFVYTIPVLAGYIFLGIAFGLLVRTSGFPIWYAVLMSVVMFTGALEFAAIPMLGQPFDPMGCFIFGLLLSARHLFYGIPMLKKYRNTGIAKPFLVFGLTDETFSLLSTVDVPENIKPKHFYVAITLIHYLYWNIGTFIGALGGDIVGDKAQGLDFAITALFLVLFVEQMKKKSGIISGFIGLLATFTVLMIVGRENMVVVSMLTIVVLLVLGRRVIDRD